MTSSKLFEMRNLKIGLVCRFPLSKKFYSFQLAEGLRNLGAEVLLYGPKWGGLQTLKEDQRILKVWSPLTYIIDIPRRAIKDRVNIVHIQFEIPTFHLIGSLLLPLLLLILKMTRKKVVVTIHGPIFPRNNISRYLKIILPNFPLPLLSMVGILIPSLYLLVDRLSDGIIVHARVFKRWLTEFGLRKIYVIYHGIDDGEIIDNDGEKDVILCLGTIAPRKGVHTFLHSISLIKDELKRRKIKAIIAGPLPSTLGDGEYLRKLFESYRDIKDVVDIKGFLLDDELKELLKRTKIMCSSYPVSICASGILAVAISKNIPIIVTNTLYFKEILGEDYPLMVQPDDSHNLSNCIYAIINGAVDLQKVYEKFSFLRKRFAWSCVAQQHLKLYLSLFLSGNSKSHF